jgi:hypothetical protein
MCTAAFISEGGPWYLHVASNQIQHKNIDAAYGEVLRLAGEMASPYLDAFQVKLIPTSDQLAQAALDINRRFPGRMASRFGGRSFGRMGVDGVSIYPAAITSTTP